MLKKSLGVTVYKLNRFKFDGLTYPSVFEWEFNSNLARRYVIVTCRILERKIGFA